MNKRFRCGLVVGKFAPLHTGHLSVIDAARAECERVVILSYSNPEWKFAPPDRRAQWLSDLFPDCTSVVVTNARLREWLPGKHREVPSNDADDETHRQFVADLLEHVVRQQVDAVFTSESYGPGFAEHLTRRQLRKAPDAPAVTHVLVDQARSRIPVSGTAVRKALWESWQYLPKSVAKTLVRRVVFLGGESTGKSTLASGMATALATLFVAEYGRELWTRKAGAFEFADFDAIAREQIKREEAAVAQARRWVFCDTSPLTTLFYCMEQFRHATSHLDRASRRGYDHVVLCAPDFPFVQDGTRQDAAFRERQHRWYEIELARRGVSFYLATGSLQNRIESLCAYLRDYDAGNHVL